MHVLQKENFKTIVCLLSFYCPVSSFIKNRFLFSCNILKYSFSFPPSSEFLSTSTPTWIYSSPVHQQKKKKKTLRLLKGNKKFTKYNECKSRPMYLLITKLEMHELLLTKGSRRRKKRLAYLFSICKHKDLTISP